MLDSMFNDSQDEARAKRRDVLDRVAAYDGKPNLVLVTHDVNIRALVNEYVAQGGIVVARAGHGRLDVVGRLRAHDSGVQ